jgi:phosphoribosylamine-glycine ligase
MNILLYSLAGDGLVFVPKILQEGHDVLLYIKDKAVRESGRGRGLVFTVDDPEPAAAQADLIIFDDNGMGEDADALRAKGYAVWNGGTFVDKLEYDRLYGMEVFRKYGIKIPDTFEVHGLDDVKAVLSSEFQKGEKLVIKLDGADAAGSSFSFIAKNPEMCREQVEHWVGDGALGGEWSGIIQRFVEGIEVSVEAWWDGETWSTHNITLEEKKLLSGNLGPSVGCAYNTIVRIDEGSRLFKEQLEPIEGLLREEGYVGQIDTNSIVNDEGAYALEWTPRCGYDATPTLAWGNDHGYVNKILYKMGLGGDFEGFGYRGRIWGGVRVYVPPYPTSLKSEKLSGQVYEKGCRGVPILDHEKVEQDFWLCDAMKDDEGRLVCAGTSGIVGVAFGAGDDPREAAAATYRVADRIQIPDKSYRALDGWKRHQDALSELRASRMVKLHPRLP